MPQPVSIIVPNYNYGRYLDERLRSLLDQTFTDFELLILDDASTDNSREIIDRYARPACASRLLRDAFRIGVSTVE